MSTIEKVLLLLFSLSVIFFFLFLYTADLISTFKLVSIVGLLGLILILVFTFFDRFKNLKGKPRNLTS